MDLYGFSVRIDRGCLTTAMHDGKVRGTTNLTNFANTLTTEGGERSHSSRRYRGIYVCAISIKITPLTS